MCTAYRMVSLTTKLAMQILNLVCSCLNYNYTVTNVWLPVCAIAVVDKTVKLKKLLGGTYTVSIILFLKFHAA